MSRCELNVHARGRSRANFVVYVEVLTVGTCMIRGSVVFLWRKCGLMLFTGHRSQILIAETRRLRHARRIANRTQRTTTTMPLAAADLEKVQSLALALRSLSSIAQSSTLAYPRVRPGWPRGAVGTEWKCPWNFGHSQCAMLFLAHGLPLSAESEAAIQWAMQLKQRLKSAILNYSLEHWPSACAHGRRRAEPD